MKKILGLMVVAILLVGCGTTYRAGTRARSTEYDIDRFVTDYMDDKVFYAPLGTKLFAPKTEALRQNAYQYVLKNFGYDKSEVILLNEWIEERRITRWSWIFNWWTYFLINFGEVQYSATFITRDNQ